MEGIVPVGWPCRPTNLYLSGKAIYTPALGPGTPAMEGLLESLAKRGKGFLSQLVFLLGLLFFGLMSSLVFICFSACPL
jgi:hypothetical protein